MQTTITVQTNDVRQTQTGKIYWSIKDTNGNRYSVWNQNAANTLKPGVSAVVEYQENNGYKSIMAVLSVQAAPQPTPTSTPKPSGNSDVDWDRIGIAKAASQLFAACYEHGDSYDTAKQKVVKALTVINLIQVRGLTQELVNQANPQPAAPAEPEPPLPDEPPPMTQEDTTDLESLPF